MKTESSTATLCFLLAFLGICNVVAAVEENDSFCNIPAAKRMLSSLGIGKHSPCLLQRKRDVAHLVSSYLENEMRSEKRGVLDEVDRLFRRKFHIGKRGLYCCSPKCDAFMSRMGNPNPILLHCEN